MSTEKTKTKAGKFLQFVGSALVRPAIKILFPFVGTPAVELVSNLLGAKKKDPATGNDVPKHSYLSIGVQAAIAIIVILDIVLNKGANLLALIDLIGLLPVSEVAEVSPAQ